MEENQKVVQLAGLSNDQYIQQFKSLLMVGQVQKITFFVTFKFKLAKQEQKILKNLPQRPSNLAKKLKEKKSINYLLNDFRSSLLCQKPCDLKEQIQALYQSNQYKKLVQILVPKEAVMKKQISQITQNTNLSIFQKLKNQYNCITFHVGNSYFRLKQFAKAAEYYEKSVQDQQIKQRAQRMNNLGTCFAMKKSYQLALKYYNEAVKLYNECENQDVSSLLNNIGMIYLKCDMLRQAEGYFRDAIKQRMAKSPNNKLMLYNSYFNLGVCQKRMGKSGESLKNLGISWNYACQGFGSKIQALTQICHVYQLDEKWNQALANYEKLSQEYDNSGQPQGIIYQKVSKIHEKLGNKILSSKFAKQAYKIYRISGNKSKMSELSNNFINTVATF